MAFVIAQKTPLKPEDVREALRYAFTGLVGHPPTEDQLALMMAQSAFETGHWGKIYNFNLGNIKVGSRYSGDRTSFPCGEVLDGKSKSFPAGDPHCQFRAYPDLRTGAVDYLSLLVGRVDWLEGLLSGDVHTYVEALATPSSYGRPYFTADPAHYENVTRQLFYKYHESKKSPASQTPKAEPEAEDTNPIAAPAPEVMPDDELWFVLRRGGHNDALAVKVLQRLCNLRMFGMTPLKDDGDFGPITEARVRDVEEALGLAQTGIVSRMLWLNLTGFHGQD